MTPEEQKKFAQALARATTTQTHPSESKFMETGNEILRELGQELGKNTGELRHSTYLGSAAVHIYALKTTGVNLYLTQAGATLNGVSEFQASSAHEELMIEMMRRFGRGARKEKKK